MEKSFKFLLPSPNFDKNVKDSSKPKLHYLTPSGMSLLPREKQPPPMYGKHGSTLPAKYLNHHSAQTQQATLAESAPEKIYCEPCEIELHSLDDLKRHRAQHEKCPVAGCLYKGHPSVMDKHINSLHTSGLFEKFKKLSTPEEIAAWREERRKRYPTVANVLLKQKAKEQRQKRGERLEDSKSRFGKDINRKRAQPRARDDKGPLDDKKIREENKKSFKKSRKRKNNIKPKNQEMKPKIQAAVKRDNDDSKDDIGLNCIGITMFRGTSQLKNYKHFNENKALATNALFGLVGMYGSDDDESTTNDSCNEDDAGNIKTVEVTKNRHYLIQDMKGKEVENSFNNDISKICDTVEEKPETSAENEVAKERQKSNTLVLNHVDQKSRITDNEPDVEKNVSDDEAPDEAPIERSVLDHRLQTEQASKPTSSSESKSKPTDIKTSKKLILKQKQSRKSGLDYRKARLRKQNTLLEKLLESDIRHERNVLLQCVRFVCENNFFNTVQNKNQENTDKNKL